MRKGASAGAMRSVFWWLGLGALAVSLALLVGSNRAVLSLFWPPYRFDVSFNLVLFALLMLFVVVYLALRAVALIRELPGRAQRWRAQQLERAAVGALLDALAFQLAGRFVRAQAAARSALEQSEQASLVAQPHLRSLRWLAHLLVAESAQSLRKTDERDEHLLQALSAAAASAQDPAREGVLLRAAHWAIEDRDASTARQRLADLPSGAARRIQALRLRLRIARLDQSTTQALEAARVLAKYRAFSPEAARSLVQGLLLDAFRQAHDLSQLQALWAPLSAQERQQPELVLAAAERALAVAATRPHQPVSARDDGEIEAENPQGTDDSAAAAALVRTWMAPVWAQWPNLTPDQQRQTSLVVERTLPHLDAAGLAKLEQIQRQWPNNAYLQYMAGQAFLQRQLWGKAHLLLTQASHSLQDAVLLRNTWRALAVLAEERADAPAAQAAWKRAAQLD